MGLAFHRGFLFVCFCSFFLNCFCFNCLAWGFIYLVGCFGAFFVCLFVDFVLGFFVFACLFHKKRMSICVIM